MWWTSFLVLLLTAIGGATAQAAEQAVVRLPVMTVADGMKKGPSRKYHVTMNWEAENTGFDLRRLVLILPYPQTNQYQKVSNVRLPSTAQVRKAQNNQSVSYLRYDLNAGALPRPGGRVSLNYEFDVELFELSLPEPSRPTTPADLARGGILPGSFAAPNMPFVDPAHPTIRSAADRLWEEARHSRMEYARKAYEYVAASYRYLNPATGIHPLSTLLQQGGGDCGNLSSIYISLLRAKAIPARHVVGVRPDGNYHAFAEFQAPGIGWVPVDVTAKNGNPNGDYFGRLALSDALVVASNDLNLVVEKEPGVSYTAWLLQSYLWWIWGSGDFQKVKPSFTLRATPL